MSETMKHWFGLPVPKGIEPVRAWGARAILRTTPEPKVVRRKGKVVGRDWETKVSVETVADRSQYRGPDITSAESKAFFTWVDKTALPQLRADADAMGLAPDEDREVILDDGVYHLRANPCRSYGYLYLVAWEG